MRPEPFRVPSRSTRRRPQTTEDEPENHERWLVTYADMLTVLMALFIVMFAISVADKQKFEALKSGLPVGTGARDTLMPSEGAALGAQTPSPRALSAAAVRDAAARADAEASAVEQTAQTLTAAQRRLEAALVGRGLRDKVRFSQDERGLVMAIVTDDVLFELGSAAIQASGRQVIDAIAPVLARLPHAISVEGHTDDLPLDGGGRYASNWELSANRATSVLRHLVEVGGVPPSRVSAYGYADQRPLVPNVAGQRGRNRRVEVVLRPIVPSGPVKDGQDAGTSRSRY